MLQRVELEACDLERVELTDGDQSPLADIEYTGNVEVDARKELDVTIEEIRATKREKQKAITKTLDTEYWVCLCFQSRQQVEEFMAKCGQPDPTHKYVDGVKFAERIGNPVTPETTPFYEQRKKSNLAAMARPIKPNKEKLI